MSNFFVRDKNVEYTVDNYYHFEMYLQELEDINQINPKKIVFTKRNLFLLKKYNFDFDTYFEDIGNIVNLYLDSDLYDLQVLMLLKILKCDFSCVTPKGNNPIHQIVNKIITKKHQEKIGLLDIIDKDMSYLLESTNDDVQTPLDIVVASNNTKLQEVVMKIYKKFGLSISNDQMSTALYEACRIVDVDAVAALIEQGAIEEPFSNGNYPAHILLGIGAYGFISDNSCDPLKSYWEKAPKIFKMLKKCDIDNNKGETPFYQITTWKLHAKCDNYWEPFIELGVDINKANHKGVTCLMNAIEAKNTKLAQRLIELNVDVNYKNKVGETAIFYAVRLGWYDMVKLLIEKGADINISNNKDQTPLAIAADYNMSKLVEILY